MSLLLSLLRILCPGPPIKASVLCLAPCRWWLMELRRLAASLLGPESQSRSATSVPFLDTGCKRTMLPQEGRGSFKGVRSSSSGSRVTHDIDSDWELLWRGFTGAFVLPHQHRLKNEEGLYKSVIMSSAGTVALVKKLLLSVQVLPGETGGSFSKNALLLEKALVVS